MDAEKQQSPQCVRLIGSSFYPEDKEADFIFNQVQDKIEEVQARLEFLSDSAPLTFTASSFSNAGLAGMSFVVVDMIDALNEAKGLLQNLIEYGRKLDTEKDQYGPTSFSAGA